MPWGGSPGHPGALYSWKGRLDERQREPAVLLTSHYILLQHPVHIPPKFSPILAREIFLQEKLQPVSKTAGQGKRPKKTLRIWLGPSPCLDELLRQQNCFCTESWNSSGAWGHCFLLRAHQRMSFSCGLLDQSKIKVTHGPACLGQDRIANSSC